MDYSKGSLNRDNDRDQATVYIVAGSRYVADSQLLQFERLNDCELNRSIATPCGWHGSTRCAQ